MDIVLAQAETGATWQINSLIETPPLRVFRQVIPLQFVTGGHADSIKIDENSTVLDGLFVPQQYDVMGGSGPINASTGAGPDSSVIITLDAPRNIRKVKIKSISYGSYEEAVSAIEQGRFNHLFANLEFKSLGAAAARSIEAEKSDITIEDIKSQAFVAYQAGDKWGLDVDKIELYRMDGETIAAEPTFTVDNNVEIEGFVSAKFAVKVIDESQSYANIKMHHVQDVIVQSYPTGPRIAIAAPVENGNTHEIIEYFWNVPGEILAQENSVPTDKDPKAELVRALTRYLNEQFTTMVSDANKVGLLPQVPDDIHVDLVLESDAPCNFEASQFIIGYTLIRQRSSFPPEGIIPPEKKVARFTGKALTGESISIGIPGNAKVVSVELKTEASFGSKRFYAVGNGMEPLGSQHRNGITITEDRWTAQCVSPDKAIIINRYALGVMALENDTELLVELQEEWNGQPSGKKLAEGKIQLNVLGQRTWSTNNLPTSISLATSPYWLLLKSTKGAALWLTRSTDGEPVQVLQAAKAQAPLVKITAISGVEALYVFFTCCPQSEQLEAPFTLTIGDTLLPPKTIERDRISFEIKDAVIAKLSNSGGNQLTNISIHLNSANAGLVTVYPPRVEYHITSP
ncbi:MAG: hypothetical protein GY799_19615 [Desulfobulbaceae bacterium]|nr:hypothetical protein [Desulfobulbaceae bacterium]